MATYLGLNATLIQEGYLYEGFAGSAAEQHLITLTVEVEPGRVLMLMQYDTPNTFDDYAQVVRFGASGYTLGPSTNLGSSFRIEGRAYINGGLVVSPGRVVVASHRFGTGYTMHLFQVAADDTVTLLSTRVFNYTGDTFTFHNYLNLFLLGSGPDFLMTDATTDAGGKFFAGKFTVSGDSIVDVSQMVELATANGGIGKWYPNGTPVQLPGDRVAFFGRRTVSPAVPVYRLFDTSLMAFVSSYEPAALANSLNGDSPPSVLVDDTHVLVVGISGTGYTNTGFVVSEYDLAGDVWSPVSLPVGGWPSEVERVANTGVWVDPVRPAAVSQYKFTAWSSTSGPMSVVGASTGVWATPLAGSQVDDNEIGVFLYDWDASEVLAWAVVKTDRFEDDLNAPVNLITQNLAYPVYLNEGVTLVLMSEYDDPSDVPSYAGNIWASVVRLGAPPMIVSDYLGSRRRFAPKRV